MRRGFDSGTSTSNPALRGGSVFQQVAGPYEAGMTIRGAAMKTALLLLIAVITAAWSWSNLVGTPIAGIAIIGSFIVAFVLALVIGFVPKTAPFLGPVYAAIKGIALGAISAFYAAEFDGIVIQAIGLTFGVLGAMLFAYTTGIIKVTRRFTMMVFAATVGIMLFYLGSFVAGFFVPGLREQLFFEPSLLSIGISLFVVVIASLNLAIDFEVINRGAQSGAPKYMEWYGAFALTVTLVWLYLEILRLLSLLRRA